MHVTIDARGTTTRSGTLRFADLDDEPIPPKHGAPLRLIIPFRYGARSIKAVTEISFTSTSFPLPVLPPAV